MGDRFTRGFIAGILAGVVPFIINYAAYSLELSTLRWADFMGKFLYGSQPQSTGEVFFAKMSQFAALGLLGIIFAYLITFVTSKNLFLKSVVYSITIWFVAFAITFLFQLPGLKEVPLKTVIANFISAISWGLALGVALKWLDQSTKI